MVCLGVSSLLRKTPAIVNLGSLLSNYICKDLPSEEGHSLRFWVDMNLGGETLFNSTPTIYKFSGSTLDLWSHAFWV